MQLSICIPIRGAYDYFLRCFDSIIKWTNIEHEILICEDGPTEAKLGEFLDKLSNDQNTQKDLFLRNRFLHKIVVFKRSSQRGFPKTCNDLISKSKGAYVAVVTSDVVVTPNWSIKLTNHLNQGAFGIMGPVTCHCSGPQLLQEYSNIKLTATEDDVLRISDEVFNRSKGQVSQVGEITGFLMLIKREVLNKLGANNHWFDEVYGLGSGEDLDICRRACLAGFKVGFARDTYVHHFGHRSFSNEPVDTKELWGSNFTLFQSKFKDVSQSSNEEAKLRALRPISADPIELAKHGIRPVTSSNSAVSSFSHDEVINDSEWKTKVETFRKKFGL